jgi:queuine tRNA-ribosyltransferase
MPVGTNGSVKALHHQTVSDMGTRLILANTYHLYLRPGIEVIRAAGGLHAFTAWPHNYLTDSGGFQIFSLAPFRKITPEGVRFRSHIDGSYHNLTPEKVVELQVGFGSDILMPLDVCSSPEETRAGVEKALNITTQWARRSVTTWKNSSEETQGQLFGIIQGQFHKDLRRRSAEEILELDTPGVAIGGLSVGENSEIFEEMTKFSADLLPENKPRYLMGIGTPDYILAAVANGIDMFDCVYPTRIARNGSVFTSGGLLDLKKSRFEKDFRPIEENCTCRACQTYTRSFLRQMFKCNEILGPMLATEHNLNFLHRFLNDIRDSIRKDRLATFRRDFLETYTKGSAE